jgi:hypothetical protein
MAFCTPRRPEIAHSAAMAEMCSDKIEKPLNLAPQRTAQ